MSKDTQLKIKTNKRPVTPREFGALLACLAACRQITADWEGNLADAANAAWRAVEAYDLETGNKKTAAPPKVIVEVSGGVVQLVAGLDLPRPITVEVRDYDTGTGVHALPGLVKDAKGDVYHLATWNV